MGGLGSGRYGGSPTADASRKIDLAWMMRSGLATIGTESAGTLRWNCVGEPAGSVSYRALFSEKGNERLVLSYTRDSGDDRESVIQTIYLTATGQNFGGKRWWMICPYGGHRAGKLYMPPGGDRFASRKAWRLAYNSQRITERDRPFEALFRLQRKLGCEQGWGNWISRPKGMHHKTFERHLEEFEHLDAKCGAEMMRVIGLLR